MKMTAKTKHTLIMTALLVAGVFLTMMALTIVGWIGRASAAPPTSDDPVSMILQIHQFIKDGAHLPAVGGGLMLLVWGLRALHEKLPAPVGPFFKTKLGGYVLGFGTALNIYVGTALIAGQPLTFGLIMQAIGTGFAASGKWEGLMDVLKKAPKVSSTVMLVLIAASAMACGPLKREGGRVGGDVVDCTVGELVHLGGLVPTILPALGQSPDWKVVGAQLEQAGARVGTCVLAMLVDRWRSSTKLATPEGAAAADEALKNFKAKFGVSVVKTTAGAR